ncbi:unnamed protein product [Angiostrongylus costaricensis]|uniref:Uncharacterized protein n=1 Tax=Angiostrongylus costaricensis TaxID=334426 RepID=A0A0R3PEV1_ANGCS|nr:unnamed protein product [Angiostrongylus costaricensis]
MSTEVRRAVESREAAAVIEIGRERKEQSSSIETGPIDESMASSAATPNTLSYVTASDFDVQQDSFETCVEGDIDSSFATCKERDEELEKSLAN